ncbi:peptidyl-prolyl cis-trans isomerase [Lactobacillus selangorensis]|uniref:Peptidyl-prolyl cis-trans isomerase n=1 Tax=Lactobacillus selangorensis TaxID=81857 RepID=A0A0R2FFU2_9LACO|nr:peptidylprolyl isomerase [Lactobacillus selangorensis]KRN27490.1 peptidyl-prolyl cis-trans isomerase [Lactobacillus selangorensis]KRN31313.1 peptidyl-prolyl cis-trans isomerase [Lactobacillus selangorensis]
MTYPQLDLADFKGPKATLTTNLGTIEVALFPEQAPKAVENFISLAKNGYYDGTVFHRVIPDFMIQGGDPTGTGMGGESKWQAPFEDEFSDELFNLNGALSMANAGPHTNGSQFFIVTNEHLDKRMPSQMQAANYPDEIIKAYQKDGGTPWLDHHHTVFGQVLSGMDVAETISRQKTSRGDKPKQDVVLEKVTITD